MRLANTRLHQQNKALRRKLERVRTTATARTAQPPQRTQNAANTINGGGVRTREGGGGNAAVAVGSYVDLLNSVGVGVGVGEIRTQPFGSSTEAAASAARGGGSVGRGAGGGSAGGGADGGSAGDGGEEDVAEAEAEAESSAAAAARVAVGLATRKAKEEVRTIRQQNGLLQREFGAANARIDKYVPSALLVFVSLISLSLCLSVCLSLSRSLYFALSFFKIGLLPTIGCF